MPAAVVAACILLFIPVGCGGGTKGPSVILAAERSLADCGILQAWETDFEKRSGVDLEIVAVPSMQAVQMARHGECDAVLVDVPREEEYMVRNGFLEERREVMRDRFLLVGPPHDPAGVRGMQDVREALEKVAESGGTVVVRDDGSGASVALQMLITTSAAEEGDWLVWSEGDAYAAMEETRRVDGYTLVDESSFLLFGGNFSLEVMVMGDPELVNPYHFLRVSGRVYPDTNLEGAGRLEEYLLSGNARAFFSMGAWEEPSPEEEKNLEEGGS